MNIFKTKYTIKSTSVLGIVFSREHAPNPVASVQMQYYSIILFSYMYKNVLRQRFIIIYTKTHDNDNDYDNDYDNDNENKNIFI